MRPIRKKGSRVNKQTVQSFLNSIPDQVFTFDRTRVSGTDAQQELAEREGFEPPIPVKVCPLSRRIVSTTHAPLRVGQIEKNLKSEVPRLRSGFRQRAQTPAKRLNFRGGSFQPLTHLSEKQLLVVGSWSLVISNTAV